MNALPDQAQDAEDDRADGLRRRDRHPDERHGVVRGRGLPRVDLPRAHRPAAHAARHLAGGGHAPAGGASRSTTPGPTSRSCRAWPSGSASPTTSTTPSSSGSRRRPRSCPSTTPSSTSRSTACSRRPGRRSTARRCTPEHRFLTKTGKIELYSRAPRRRPATTRCRCTRAPAQPPPGSLPHGARPQGDPHPRRRPPTTCGSPSMTPTNDLWINPEPAARLGIGNGDLVEVAPAARARCSLPARVTEEIRPDCVFMLHGFGKKSKALCARVRQRRVRRGGARDRLGQGVGQRRLPRDLRDRRRRSGRPLVRERLGAPAKKRYALALDTRKCINCKACVVACKAENDVPLGDFRNRINEEPRRRVPAAAGLVRARAVPPLREPVVRAGVPDRRLVPARGRPRPGRRRRLHRLRLLHHRLPLRRPVLQRGDAGRRQVHDVRPPRRRRAAAGLRRDLPDQGPHLRRPRRPGRPRSTRSSPPAAARSRSRRPATTRSSTTCYEEASHAESALGPADRPLPVPRRPVGRAVLRLGARHLPAGRTAGRPTPASPASARCWRRGRWRSARRCWSSTSATGTASTSCS